MKLYEYVQIILLPLFLFSLTGAIHSPAPVRRANEVSFQNSSDGSYYCMGFNDYSGVTENGLNGTECNCGGFGNLQLSGVPRNLTDFSDPAQCTDYVLVDARGTLETEGEISSGYIGIAYGALAQVPNGAFYSVRYPAGPDQNTTLGVQDVVNSLNQGIVACPNRTYALSGSSQGASVILGALPLLSDEIFNRVKAVVLVANPFRTPGKKSNVDGRGAHTSESDKAAGIYAGQAGAVELPTKWDESGKAIDICLMDDGICNSRKTCRGLKIAHFMYGAAQGMQVVTSKHLMDRLLAN